MYAPEKQHPSASEISTSNDAKVYYHNQKTDIVHFLLNIFQLILMQCEEIFMKIAITKKTILKCLFI